MMASSGVQNGGWNFPLSSILEVKLAPDPADSNIRHQLSNWIRHLTEEDDGVLIEEASGPLTRRRSRRKELLDLDHSNLPIQQEAFDVDLTGDLLLSAAARFADDDGQSDDDVDQAEEIGGGNAHLSVTPRAKFRNSGMLAYPTRGARGALRKRRAGKPVDAAKPYFEVDRDEKGNPILPIRLGLLTVLQLGTIDSKRMGFHSKRYIWPIGFKSQRLYPSVRNPEKKVIYTCEILDGENAPLFLVTPEDGEPICAISSTAAWIEITSAVNAYKSQVRGRRVFTIPSGPEMYGFSNPTILNLIQQLPGAKNCSRYHFQKFILQKEPARRGRPRRMWRSRRRGKGQYTGASLDDSEDSDIDAISEEDLDDDDEDDDGDGDGDEVDDEDLDEVDDDDMDRVDLDGEDDDEAGRDVHATRDLNMTRFDGGAGLVGSQKQAAVDQAGSNRETPVSPLRKRKLESPEGSSLSNRTVGKVSPISTAKQVTSKVGIVVSSTASAISKGKSTQTDPILQKRN